MIRPRSSLLALSALLALGCHDTLVQPDVEPSSAKGGRPGKPGIDPGAIGMAWASIGYPAVLSGPAPAGAVSGTSGSHRSLVSVGETVAFAEAVVNLGYFQVQLPAGNACFPEAQVTGSLSLGSGTGGGQAVFSFIARTQDATSTLAYVLTLDGPPWAGGWPVVSGARSAFAADTWTLTASEGKGRKGRGCTGSGSFAAPIRIELRHIAPTTSVPTAPFLTSPFDPAAGAAPVQRFDHTGPGDGLVVDFLGEVVSGEDGHGGYDWALPANTAVRAAAAGRVTWAGAALPWACPGTGEVVDGEIIVVVEHAGGGGTPDYAVLYRGLSSVAVKVGDPLAAGDVIGASATGGACGGGALLHMTVAAVNTAGVDLQDRYATWVDPYGWSGQATDPWAARLEGAVSRWLWLPGPGSATHRAVWLWEAEAYGMLDDPWAREDAFDFLEAQGVTTIYFYADAWGGRNIIAEEPHKYRALVAAMRARGLTPYALLGSAPLNTPSYVLPENRALGEAMFQRLLDYNAAAAEHERFVGVNIDIEPYLLPEWRENEQQISIYYLELSQRFMQMKAASGQTLLVGSATPFWFDNPLNKTIEFAGATKLLHQHVQDIHDYVAIMAFRDFAVGSNGILVHATAEMDYGAVIGKPVVVAVNVNPTSTEPEWVTFWEEGIDVMEQELGVVESQWGQRSEFGGTAINHYRTLRELAARGLLAAR